MRAPGYQAAAAFAAKSMVSFATMFGCGSPSIGSGGVALTCDGRGLHARHPDLRSCPTRGWRPCSSRKARRPVLGDHVVHDLRRLIGLRTLDVVLLFKQPCEAGAFERALAAGGRRRGVRHARRERLSQLVQLIGVIVDGIVQGFGKITGDFGLGLLIPFDRFASVEPSISNVVEVLFAGPHPQANALSL